MNMQAEGKLIEKTETVQVTDRLKKKEFVIEITERIKDITITSYARFTLLQSRCDIIDPYRLGDNITVSFNLKGYKTKDEKPKYCNVLEAWRISPVVDNQHRNNNKADNQLNEVTKKAGEFYGK